MNAHQRHYEFMKKYNFNLPSSDEIEQKVLDLMHGENGKKYIKQQSRIQKCGHPGVRHNGNCAFCEVIERSKIVQSDPSEAREKVLRSRLEALRKEVTDIENQLALIDMGVPVRTTVTRQEALAAGLKWYTPENPCKHCGTFSERYVANGKCKGCKS